MRLFMILTALVLFTATTALAYPSFYSSRCASCHSDDSATCNGCHLHHYSISAMADQDTYDPGSIVTVTLNGGSEHGWVRGLLYDGDDLEVDRATGPTGTGDDGQGNAVTFPVTLQATAPAIPGTYTWEAAWFGGATSGSGHLENRTSVTIQVEGTSSVPEPAGDSWGKIKALYR